MLFILKNMLVATAVFASTADAQVTADFGYAADFTDNFTVIDSGASGSIAYSSSAGAAGLPGRLNASVPENSGKMVYWNQPFSLSEGPLHFSFLFMGNKYTGNSNACIAIGISPDKINLRDNVRVQARLINDENAAASFHVRSALSGSVSTSGVVLASNHWYRLEATFSLSETAGAVDVGARLTDWGVTGSMAQEIVAEASGTRSDSTFFDSGVPKDVFVGFLVQNANGGGQAIDDIALPVFDFSSDGQLSRYFEVVKESVLGSLGASTNDGVGAVSGRIDLSGITTASGEGLYSVAEIDPDDGKIGASFFFLADAYVNNGRYSRIALGLSPDRKDLLNYPEVQARLLKGNSSNTATFEIRGGSGTNTTGVVLTSGHWYKVSAVFATYGTQSFQVVAALEDYGTNGTVLAGTVASASAVKTEPADFFDGADRLPLSVGILAQKDGGGADVLDQIQIPESSQISPSKGPDLFSWRTTMGTHYRIYTNAVMGTIRSFPTPSKLSYYPDVTALQPSNELTSVAGHFSGEQRYYDFEGVLDRGSIGHNYADYLRQAAAGHVDLIWNLGQIHHTDTGHVNFVMTNNGAYFKDLIYQAVLFVNSGEFEDDPITVYWEIGNEINSPYRFSLADYGTASNNLAHADDYLEYYLAPAVEAIRAASQTAYGDSNVVRFLMGNLTHLGGTNSSWFLDRILNGTIAGTHAPTLAGKKGHEIVDTIGIHYSKGIPSTQDKFYEWVNDGKVSGLWNTEEEGDAQGLFKNEHNLLI